MKKVITIFIVVVVILSMAAGYLFSGLSIQPKQPSGQPSVQGPSSAPSVNGPTIPPVQ